MTTQPELIGGERTFGARDVCDLTGISYRQLDYWARTGLLEPTANHAAGSGVRRRWSSHDVAVLAVVGHLIRHGALLEHLRPVVPLLAALEPHEWDRVAYIADGRIWFSLGEAVEAGVAAGQFIDLGRFRDIGRREGVAA